MVHDDYSVLTLLYCSGGADLHAGRFSTMPAGRGHELCHEAISYHSRAFGDNFDPVNAVRDIVFLLAGYLTGLTIKTQITINQQRELRQATPPRLCRFYTKDSSLAMIRARDRGAARYRSGDLCLNPTHRALELVFLETTSRVRP